MSSEKKQLFQRVLACLCIIGFGVVLGLVLTRHAAGFDDPVRQFFYDMRAEGLTGVLTALTNLANKYFIIVMCLLLLIIPQTRLRFGVPLSAGALGTILINSALKRLICRPRPEVLHLVEEDGFSFPSGHSLMSMFFYGMAIWLVWHYASAPDAADHAKAGLPGSSDSPASGRLPDAAEDAVEGAAAADRHVPRYEKKTAIIVTILLLIPLVTVGLTRIYLGVHYPTDVLGGWLLAGFAVFIEAEIIVMVERRRSPRA